VAATLGSATARVSTVGVYCTGAAFAALFGFVTRLVADRVVLLRFVVDRVLDVAFFTAIASSSRLGTP
jgi:hypothetical protein